MYHGVFSGQLQGLDTEPGTQSWILWLPSSMPRTGRSAQAAQVRQSSSRMDRIKEAIFKDREMIHIRRGKAATAGTIGAPITSIGEIP
jgi:hypothetical protein